MSIKANAMFFEKKIIEPLPLDGEEIENVEEIGYLGSLLIWDNDCSIAVLLKLFSVITHF